MNKIQKKERVFILGINCCDGHYNLVGQTSVSPD